jgi:hypothetical protein
MAFGLEGPAKWLIRVSYQDLGFSLDGTWIMKSKKKVHVSPMKAENGRSPKHRKRNEEDEGKLGSNAQISAQYYNLVDKWNLRNSLTDVNDLKRFAIGCHQKQDECSLFGIVQKITSNTKDARGLTTDNCHSL